MKSVPCRTFSMLRKMATNRHRTLPTVEQDIRSAMAALEAAEDEKAAARAYARLHHNTSEYIRRSGDLRSEYYRLRNTVTRQAKDISQLAIEAVIGEAAPSEPTDQAYTSIHQPEVVAIEAAPDFFFIRLSYGFINIRHIVELDVKARTLFTTSGTRNLQPDDVRILVHHLKLYRPR